MKRFIALGTILVFAVGPAIAEHIDLYHAGGFGALKQFYSVANDANPVADITIVESNTYTSITLTIDGKTYSSPVGGGAGNSVNALLTSNDGSGEQLVYNAYFSTYTTYSGSGRGQHYTTHYTLEGGSIDRGAPLPTDTAPIVYLSGLTNGSTVSKTVTLQAKAFDDHGVVAVAYAVDGELLPELASPYLYAWDTTLETNEVHTITAHAYDTAGNESVSGPVTVTVDNGSPVITSTPGTGNAEAGTTYQYAMAATGNPQPTFALVSAPYGMNINPISGLVTWATTAADIGSYSVTASVSNVYATVQQTWTVSVVDTTPPSVPTGFTASKVAKTSISLKWNASADLSGVSGYRVYQFSNGAWSIVKNNLTAKSVTISNLKASTQYTYAVTSYDIWGNESAKSASLIVTTTK